MRLNTLQALQYATELRRRARTDPQWADMYRATADGIDDDYGLNELLSEHDTPEGSND